MENLEIYKKFAEVPKEAQKTITGGRLNGKTDINPMWRIKSLTEQFGACGFGWYYEVLNKWLEKGANEEISGFVEINLFVKIGEEWSKGIYGIGGSMFVAKEKSGLFTSDEVYKMATTDAISVACKQLGFGANVYWQADSTKYTKSKEEKPTESQPKEITPPVKKPTEEQLKKAVELNIELSNVAKYYKVGLEQLTSNMLNFAITLKERALKNQAEKGE